MKTWKLFFFANESLDAPLSEPSPCGAAGWTAADDEDVDGFNWEVGGVFSGNFLHWD